MVDMFSLRVKKVLCQQEELLASRKATRKLIKFKTVTLKNGENYSGLLNKGEEEYTIIPEKGNKITVSKDDVVKIEDTYNDFMKNVFDKRQLSKKVVANSLYGQSGATTSAFYDKDIAASTTATGRKLLLYAKRIVEECYKDRIVDTKIMGKLEQSQNIFMVIRILSLHLIWKNWMKQRF